MSAFWKRLREAAWFRRSVRTFLQAFLALMVPGSLGWLNDLTAWARAQGQTPFPDAHSLAYIGVSAITAGVIAVISGLWVKVEDVAGHGLLRTIDPPPPPNEGGAADADVVLIASGVALLLVYAFALRAEVIMILAVIALVVGIVLAVTRRSRL